jgi:hypothetical protein
MADDPEQQGLEDVPRRRALDPERHMAGLLARQPGRVSAGDLEGDLCSRVARSDHEGAAFLELGRVVVAGRVELDDIGTEVGGEGGYPGDLEGRHGHHRVVGLPAAVARGDYEPAVVLEEPVHPDAGPNRELEPGRVGLQVVGHLVLGGERVGRSGEGEPGQRVVPGRSEQAERVPAVAPGVTDPLVGVQDQERPSPPGQVVADRQAGLAATDDHGLEVLWLTLGHARLPLVTLTCCQQRYERSRVRPMGSSPQAVSPCCMANSAAAARVETPILA